MNLLILGGTTEASGLARALADTPGLAATLSLAGRTRAPAPQALPTRIGGFGGADGLARYLSEHRIDAVIDATHPFAANITRNAVQATRARTVPLLILRRPPWAPIARDFWQCVPDMRAAAEALGGEPRRVFVTVGRQDLLPFHDAPWHHYVLRSIDPPPPELVPPRAEIITARGPFSLDAECRLLRDRRIDIVVTKNSGGAATEAKLAAARALALPVIMIDRPAPPDALSVETISEALDWIVAIHQAIPRGV